MIIRVKRNQHEFGEAFKEVLFMMVIAILDFLKIHEYYTLKHPSQHTSVVVQGGFKIQVWQLVNHT